MNIILITADQWADAAVPVNTDLPTEVTVDERQSTHILQVLKAGPGDQLRTGVVDRGLGTAHVLRIDAGRVTLAVTLDTAPPAPAPVSVLLALPRPKVLRRIVHQCTTLGVKEVHVVNSWRVDKSYWQSPLLELAAIESVLHAGLEQARDVVLPRVSLHQRFKPFVEDQLPALIESVDEAWLAHPTPTTPPLVNVDQTRSRLLVFGPEGGFIPYEVEKLEAAGCQSVSLGPRILKVETAVTALLGRLLV